MRIAPARRRAGSERTAAFLSRTKASSTSSIAPRRCRRDIRLDDGRQVDVLAVDASAGAAYKTCR